MLHMWKLDEQFFTSQPHQLTLFLKFLVVNELSVLSPSDSSH